MQGPRQHFEVRGMNFFFVAKFPTNILVSTNIDILILY